MGLVRYTVDRNATIALRFDDDDFLDALASADGDLKDQLCRWLNVEGGSPADADLSAFVGDGTTIHARAGITGREDARLSTMAQMDDARKGSKVDVARAIETQWGAWVTRVEDNVADGDGVPRGLSSSDRKTREETFGALPAPVQDAFTARLRIHIRDVNRGALRDPDKTRPSSTGKVLAPNFDNAHGSSADAQTDNG